MSARTRALPALLALLAAGAPAEEPAPGIEVVAEPAAVEAARERVSRILAEREGRLLLTLPRGPADPRDARDLRERKWKIVPRLLAVARGTEGESPETRKNALLTLRDFGEPHEELLPEILPGLESESRFHFLRRLLGVREKEAMPLLVQDLSDPDPLLRGQAAYEILKHVEYRDPSFSVPAEPLLAMLDDPKVPGKRFVAALLARRAPGEEAVRRTAAAIRRAGPEGDAASWLFFFLSCGDPSAAGAARAALAGIAGGLPADSPDRAGIRVRLLETGDRGALAEVRGFLQGASGRAASPLWDPERALLAIAKAEGPAAADSLLPLLRPAAPADPAEVLRALGAAAAGTGDDALVRRMEEGAVKIGSDPRTAAALVDALLRIGGPAARAAAARRAPDLAFSDRWSLLGRLGNRTVAGCLARLVQIRALPEPIAPPEREAIEKEGLLAKTDLASLLLALARLGAAVFPGEESEPLPPRHQDLVWAFSRASRALFVPEAVHQDESRTAGGDVAADDAVQFIHKGKLFRFRTDPRPDRADPSAVAAAVNRALDESGRRERFIELRVPGGGYLLGHPSALADAARELHLPLEIGEGGFDRGDKALTEELVEALGKARP